MKHLLFDFDGVIVDSTQAVFDATVAAHNSALTQEEFRRISDGNVHDHPILRDRRERGEELNTENIFFQNYIPSLMAKPPVEGIGDIIKAMSTTMRLVVVSSGITSPIEEYLRTYDLFEYFDRVYGADVHISKHAKIGMVFEEFNTTANDCLFITDTLGDMREATMANVPSIGVSWGVQETETLLNGNPLGIADNVEELTAMINQWAQK